MMKAAVYRGANQVSIEELPIPAMGDGEALVAISACGVCGTDLKKIHFGLVEPPRVFGHEMAGRIAALGHGVEGWMVGERVAVMHHVPCLDCYYCSQHDYAQCATYKRTGTTAGFEPAGGGFAGCIRVMDWVVRRGMVRIPDDISDEEATFVEPLNTVLKGVEKARIREGHTVLVIGQGQIGLLFNQVLRLRGATVVASDPISWRRENALRFGAVAALDPAGEDLARAVRDITDGRGADLAVVAVASTSVVKQAFDSVRPGGKVLLFAQTRLNDPLEVDAGDICMLEKDLIGSYSADISLQDLAAELIFTRQVNVRDLVTHRFPLENIGRALELAAHPAEGALKVMVRP
jgi:L-iditol 2-dehydrogenase